MAGSYYNDVVFGEHAAKLQVPGAIRVLVCAAFCFRLQAKAFV